MAAKRADGGHGGRKVRFEEKTFSVVSPFNTAGTAQARSRRQLDQTDRTSRKSPNVACDKEGLLLHTLRQAGGRQRPMTDRNYGITGNKKVTPISASGNKAENGMGVPLPSGRVRVARLDTADGSLEFIGEDRIDHTPGTKLCCSKLGSAFDGGRRAPAGGFQVNQSQHHEPKRSR